MIASYYLVTVYDGEHNELASYKAYSFDEAYWNINNARDMFPNAFEFSITYPRDQYEKEMNGYYKNIPMNVN